MTALFVIVAIAAYLGVGAALAPTAYRVAYRSSSSSFHSTAHMDGSMALWLMLIAWPLGVFWLIARSRLTDEDEPNPDGLTKKQRRDLSYQRQLLELLEQQEKAAEAALRSQLRAQSAMDRSPLNLDRAS